MCQVKTSNVQDIKNTYFVESKAGARDQIFIGYCVQQNHSKRDKVKTKFNLLIGTHPLEKTRITIYTV